MSTIKAGELKTAKEIIEWAKKNGVENFDLKFVDIPGTLQHTGKPLSQLTDDMFEEGAGFDGSSIRAWRSIESSDMQLRPDPATAVVDPFYERKTLSFFCNVFDPISGQSYERDPRAVAKRAEEYLKASGIGDTAFVGPEAEFFVFDDVRYEQSQSTGFFEVDSVEARWNTGRDERPNLGYKIRSKGGYFPAPPFDTLTDLRQDVVAELQNYGMVVEAEHHEVATAGQCEIDFKFDTLLKTADNLNWFKYVVRNVARQHGKVATFMPKPLFGDNGSGMHCHVSIWKDGKPLFAGDKYAGVSDLALWFIGGILKHGKSLVAITNPTTNSYKRLVPGYEAPISLAYSARNRSAAIRIPLYSLSPKAKRIEFRTPDPTANPYLAFSAILLAGLDGIENRIDPGEPMDKDIYSLSAEERKGIPAVPGSLDEALRALEADHAYLLKGGVFTEDLLRAYINFKYDNEVQYNRLRPTPAEYELYFDA